MTARWVLMGMGCARAVTVHALGVRPRQFPPSVCMDLAM